ncbi:hypothetical protein GCM10011613_37110 [Cellvibrio zantedeschiae]|uniref:VCBS repeat-containing protein n=1 Tax=Cellvibrio zantedeschiae TaxID=1237077 RepID=A0ABQ3BB37_9GAMM|nr:hypothetical protein [Cellvibrio zantedeschiae]GGY88636.1 hypothetical protein GCM10011613_37110 [Cellvibrio zantedeschiae]
MIIANAQIAMNASHDYREEHTVSEKLDFWLAGPPLSTTPEETPTNRWDEQVTISARGFSLLELQRNRYKVDLNSQLDARSRVNLIILQRLYEAITGQPMNMVEPLELKGEDTPTKLDVDAAPASSEQSPGYGMIYRHTETYKEQEKLEFNAQGVIHTQDGRAINFSSSLTMSRSYVEESSLTIRGGNARKIDPIVINFDGEGVKLSQTKFKFDLDNDGSAEQIASLRPGNGFLALDRNGDGAINNGSELFGPSSGRGFSELAQFDEDGNHFIDEGDSIYHKLRIWSFNEDGSQQLVALGDKNIGAIFLGHVTSPFQLKDGNNQSAGEIANSGIYVKEDGDTGIVQEINLTV